LRRICCFRRKIIEQSDPRSKAKRKKVNLMGDERMGQQGRGSLNASSVAVILAALVTKTKMKSSRQKCG